MPFQRTLSHGNHPKVRHISNLPHASVGVLTIIVPGPGPANRRLQVLQSLISALQKLAAARDILIVVLSQCATRMQAERGATLVPSINANAWEQAIASRLVLFRNWAIRHEKYQSAHFAGIQKLDGRSMPRVIGPIFAFDIQTVGSLRFTSNTGY